MYRAYGLLQPGSDFAAGEAVARLRSRFPGYDVALNGDQITVSKGDWEIELKLTGGPDVLAESVVLAERIAGLEDGVFMERCDRRVEVWSDTPDPFVEHLADFHAVIETLKSFAGVVVVDPKEPALM